MTPEHSPSLPPEGAVDPDAGSETAIVTHRNRKYLAQVLELSRERLRRFEIPQPDNAFRSSGEQFRAVAIHCVSKQQPGIEHARGRLRLLQVPELRLEDR